MFIHLLDSLLILLDDKMTLDLHGGSELSPSKAEVVRDYDELVNLNTKDIWINNHPHSQSFSIPWQHWTQPSYLLSGWLP